MSVRSFHMSHSNLRTPCPIHFKFNRVIGIDGLTVGILYGEISNFHSRVMGLYSSNCRWFFVCRAVNWEPLGQFTSNFAQLLEFIVLRSVYFLVKFRFFIPELWERNSLQILYECWREAYHALLVQLFIITIDQFGETSGTLVLLEINSTWNGTTWDNPCDKYCVSLYARLSYSLLHKCSLKYIT